MGHHGSKVDCDKICRYKKFYRCNCGREGYTYPARRFYELRDSDKCYRCGLRCEYRDPLHTRRCWNHHCRHLC